MESFPSYYFGNLMAPLKLYLLFWMLFASNVTWKKKRGTVTKRKHLDILTWKQQKWNYQGEAWRGSITVLAFQAAQFHDHHFNAELTKRFLQLLQHCKDLSCNKVIMDNILSGCKECVVVTIVRKCSGY